MNVSTRLFGSARCSDFRRPTARTPYSFVLAASALALAGSCGSQRLGNRDTQTPASAPATIVKRDLEPRVDQPGRVSAFIQVLNGNGSPAANLTGADFRIYEDNVLVSQSESFQQIRPQPQVFRNYLHLLIDRSNSVQASGSVEVENAAREFVELLMPSTAGSTYMKISWFDGGASLQPIPNHDLGFTNDRERLLRAIDDLNLEPVFNPSTNLYGAVDQGLDDLDEIDAEALAANIPNRALALVTFTDGTHQAGGPLTVGALVGKIQGGSSQMTPYSAFTIGVGQEIDPAVLAALGPSGSVSAAEFNVLDEAFLNVGRQVQNLANSYYFLTYCSPKSGGMHDLTISVRETLDPAFDATYQFNADFFGAGCAFLDVREHASLAAPGERAFLTDAIELDTGEVVVVGYRSVGCLTPGCGSPARAFVARFRASAASVALEDAVDGRLDTTFGDDGILFLESGASAFEVSGATSVEVVLNSGELLIGGWSRSSAQSGFSAATVWSVDPLGSSASRTLIPGSTSADEAITALARTPGGALIAGGHRGINGARSFVVWRLFQNLVVDAAFGDGGAVVDPALPEPQILGVTDLVLGGGDRVYAVGGTGQRIRVLALNQVSGAFVPSFGGDGRADAVSLFGGLDRACSPGGAVLDGSGRLVVAGTYIDQTPGGTREQPALWRILDTGAPDLSFRGSPSSPSANTGVVTLRTGSTNDPLRDFGADTRLDDVTIGPDGTLLATGRRRNGEGHTDLAIFAFNDSGVAEGRYNIVGFVIDDGATADNSFESGTLIRVLDSGAIWALGTSNVTNPASGGGANGDIPVVWVDRDPARAFAPIGQ